MGDLNLAEDDKACVFGGDVAATFDEDEWDALKEMHFQPLLPPGQPTNMHPPASGTHALGGWQNFE
jgi:hypothetical protein